MSYIRIYVNIFLKWSSFNGGVEFCVCSTFYGKNIFFILLNELKVKDESEERKNIASKSPKEISMVSFRKSMCDFENIN